MSPSVLPYGNVDNDKCRKVISTHTKRAAIPKRFRISEFGSKMVSVFVDQNYIFLSVFQSISQSRNSLDINWILL